MPRAARVTVAIGAAGLALVVLNQATAPSLDPALERAAVVARKGTLRAEDLPTRVLEAPPPRVVSEAAPANPTMELVERAYIAWVLQAESGNKTRAAEVLGIDPSTLYRKLNRYGIEV